MSSRRWLQVDTAEDPYGNKGVVLNPQWSAQWSNWSPQRRDDYIAGVAGWSVLSTAQAGQLLQGIPPNPGGWEDDPAACLGEFRGILRRLHHDVRRGALPPSSTIREFVNWCRSLNVHLPEPFLRALPAFDRQPALPTEPTLETGTSSSLARWVPEGLGKGCQSSAPPARLRGRGRGRPRTAAARDRALVKKGTDFLYEQAEKGVNKTIVEVAKHLHTLPESDGVSVKRLERILKGKLPLESAAADAAKVRRAARKRMSTR